MKPRAVPPLLVPLLPSTPLVGPLHAVCAPSEVAIGDSCHRLVGYFDECDHTQQCNYVGGLCEHRRCVCGARDIFSGVQCVRDAQLPASSVTLCLVFLSSLVWHTHFTFSATCGTNQVAVNGQCYPIVSPGGACHVDQQCQTAFLDITLACIGGVCRQNGGWTPQPRDTGGKNFFNILHTFI